MRGPSIGPCALGLYALYLPALNKLWHWRAKMYTVTIIHSSIASARVYEAPDIATAKLIGDEQRDYEIIVQRGPYGAVVASRRVGDGEWLDA